MAGGVGSRFWPESTEEQPKQFLDILGIGKSLITITYQRFLKLVPKENIFIVTNKQYKNLCIQHLKDIPEMNILLEPTKNNTAPCVAYAALRLKAIDSNAIFITAPADHVIEKETVFLKKVEEAFEHVEQNNSIVTLGITPTRPDTGFGYIETSDDAQIRKVSEFKEKPDLETAKKYLESGNYLWNAGIFIWSADGLLESFKKYAPEITNILGEDISKYNTPLEQEYIDSCYHKTPNISVDYAILEKAKNVYTIPSDIGWSDLGTWSSLYSYLDKNEDGNVIQSDAALSFDNKNTIFKSSGIKKAVIKGLDDYIVVVNEDSLLIYPKNQEQLVKEEIKKLER